MAEVEPVHVVVVLLHEVDEQLVDVTQRDLPAVDAQQRPQQEVEVLASFGLMFQKNCWYRLT